MPPGFPASACGSPSSCSIWRMNQQIQMFLSLHPIALVLLSLPLTNKCFIGERHHSIPECLGEGWGEKQFC